MPPRDYRSPQSPRLLIARFGLGRFVCGPQRDLLLEADRPVHIGVRALDLLIVLVERAGEVVSKKELFARVWGRP